MEVWRKLRKLTTVFGTPDVRHNPQFAVPGEDANVAM
jgi:hypothetical protein